MNVQITTRYGQFFGELVDQDPPEWAKPAGMDIAIRHEDHELGGIILSWMRKSDIVSVSVLEEHQVDEEES